MEEGGPTDLREKGRRLVVAERLKAGKSVLVRRWGIKGRHEKYRNIFAAI